MGYKDATEGNDGGRCEKKKQDEKRSALLD